MKYLLHILSLIFTVFVCQAQMNCKNSRSQDLEFIKTCLHKNAQVSTKEIWDKDKRQGKSLAFNSKGEQLYEFYLRNFGGHASAHVSYYSNGQVSKVEYSSAPDAGIQWYRETIKFDENGKQIEKWVDQHPHEWHTEPTFQPTVQPTKIKENVIECAVPYLTVYKIKNTTNRKIEVKLIPQRNTTIQLNEKIIVIKSNQFAVLDSILLAQRFLAPNEGYLITLNLPKRKAEKYQLLSLETIQEKERKIYQWVIVRH
jgi:hypothetical protein